MSTTWPRKDSDVTCASYVRKRQSMDAICILPINWLSGSSVMRAAVQSACLSGELNLVRHCVIGTAPAVAPPPSDTVLGKRSASVMSEEVVAPPPQETKKAPPPTTPLDTQAIALDIDAKRQWFDGLEECAQNQALSYAVQQWRASRPDVVLLSPQQSNHQCKDRLTLAIHQRNAEDDRSLRKNAPRKRIVQQQQAIVPYSCNGRPMPCQLTRLTTIIYRSGHQCVIDNDRRVRLCPLGNRPDLHRTSLELWRDDTLYMCNTSGWAHRCGKHCRESIMVSATQYCYTCPITGLSDASRCLAVTSFWTPENEMRDVSGTASSGSSNNDGGGGGSGGGNGGADNGSANGGGFDSGSSGSGGSGVLSNEDLRLRQMFKHNGELRWHGETIIHQLNYHAACHDWVHQLVARRTRAEIQSFSHDYIRATMGYNRPVGYLITAMCDLWMLLCPERRELEMQRLYKTHAQATELAQRHFLTQRQQHRRFPHASPPPSLLDLDTHYYAPIARVVFPILPAVGECTTFIVTQAHALVQLWYVLHTCILAPSLPSHNDTAQSPPKGAIAFAKFTMPALRLLARGVVRPALLRGELDQVLIAPQHALLMILPDSSVLHALCGGVGETQYRALSLEMENAMIRAVRSGRCSVEQLDFTRIPFERMNSAHFYSLDLRER